MKLSRAEIRPLMTAAKTEAQADLDALDAKINALLPPRYQGCLDDVPTRSMGTAALKYDESGQVAWNEIWTSFCHLALAGGPPHRGTLLPPVSPDEIAAQPDAYKKVVAELDRGIRMTTWLATARSATPGWVGIRCYDEDMSGWLESASDRRRERRSPGREQKQFSFCRPGRASASRKRSRTSSPASPRRATICSTTSTPALDPRDSAARWSSRRRWRIWLQIRNGIDSPPRRSPGPLSPQPACRRGYRRRVGSTSIAATRTWPFGSCVRSWSRMCWSDARRPSSACPRGRMRCRPRRVRSRRRIGCGD